ncbi:hypothetical protein E2C01_089366 [Portunus trituberculatus]|uniref:Uncharacterized protein n=1 Tax=Portunus trituberculatus TaxID=210409 RepID=A0A5B7JBR5_PORTR|nr:hypothetical protein [Portunus trituberculatus]
MRIRGTKTKDGHLQFKQFRWRLKWERGRHETKSSRINSNSSEKLCSRGGVRGGASLILSRATAAALTPRPPASGIPDVIERAVCFYWSLR